MDIAEIQKIKNDLTPDLARGKAINEENTKNWYILQSVGLYEQGYKCRSSSRIEWQ